MVCFRVYKSAAILLTDVGSIAVVYAMKNNCVSILKKLMIRIREYFSYQRQLFTAIVVIR